MYHVPFVSNKSNKKFGVLVVTPSGGQKTVYFGDSRYEDYTQHHDEQRRKSYLQRSAGIRDKNGNLTKDDPISDNYWSRRYLWLSEEPWYLYVPPQGAVPVPELEAIAPIVYMDTQPL